MIEFFYTCNNTLKRDDGNLAHIRSFLYVCKIVKYGFIVIFFSTVNLPDSIQRVLEAFLCAIKNHSTLLFDLASVQHQIISLS